MSDQPGMKHAKWRGRRYSSMKYTDSPETAHRRALDILDDLRERFLERALQGLLAGAKLSAVYDPNLGTYAEQYTNDILSCLDRAVPEGE